MKSLKPTCVIKAVDDRIVVEIVVLGRKNGDNTGERQCSATIIFVMSVMNEAVYSFTA